MAEGFSAGRAAGAFVVGRAAGAFVVGRAAGAMIDDDMAGHGGVEVAGRQGGVKRIGMMLGAWLGAPAPSPPKSTSPRLPRNLPLNAWHQPRP